MRFSVATSRAMLAIVALVIAALVVAPRSGAAFNTRNGPPLLTPNTGSGVCQTAPPQGASPAPAFCYEILTNAPGPPTFITGINVNGVIVGAYTKNDNSNGSFAAAPVATPNQTLPVYNTFVLENDNGQSLYLSGLDDGKGLNTTSEYLAGYLITNANVTKGVIYNPDNPASKCQWCIFLDPGEGSSPCNVTEVLAINDSRIGVGFYETHATTGSGCVKHAFEVYGNVVNGDLQSPYTYVDLTPFDPFGCIQGATSSEATGISPLGDVVGDVTCNTGSSPKTASWIYREAKYTNFCYTSNTTIYSTSCGAGAFSTYAMGINFSEVVVGYYTDNNKHKHGFAIDPIKGKAQFTHIDITGMSDTVLSAVLDATQTGGTGYYNNENTFWSGWAKTSGGIAQGIVGMCTAPQGCLPTPTPGP